MTFGVIWYLNPEGNWEPPFALFTLFFIATELFRRYGPKSKKRLNERFSPGQLIQHRERLRKEFQEEIYKCRAKNLRQDVIVRHVDRVDNYPNIDKDEKGISPWFRVSLLDTYKKGIVLGLRIGSLKKCENGYRFTNYKAGEKGDVTAILMGDVPYESIEAVNFEGDEYYYFPHIYCSFDFNDEPYERLWFCEKIDQPHGHPYFKELASYESVQANNTEDESLYFA